MLHIYTYQNMATFSFTNPTCIERLKSERNKDKATIQGFIYTLNRFAKGIEHWVCEKRGSCKARLHTINNEIVQPETLLRYILNILMVLICPE